MDMCCFPASSLPPATDSPQLPDKEALPENGSCLVTAILRDLVQESPTSPRFLSCVLTAMDRYQHHAVHIALGSIAELARLGQVDLATRTAILDIIRLVNQHC